MGSIKVAKNPKQGRGKSIKPICPKCMENYLQVIYIHETTDIGSQKWVKIGLYCRNCKHHELTNGNDEIPVEE